jgi:hypothetical protein
MDGHSESNILTDPVNSAACPKCGAMLEVTGLDPFTAVQCPACEFEFQVPARFGNFMLLQLLGAGGMGGVYRARDEGLNREVAIKVMLKSLGDDPQFVETFQREAQAAAKLNHPHIAQIYSFGQEKGQPYIAMELVSGGSLDRMMAVQGPLDPTTVIHIGAQVAEGLREAAEAGLVHGDVKPENILFDNDKNAKLVDFGLSAMASGPGNDVWGTPYYIAPEKVRRQKSDFRSDIYSLGGTLYHAIAGVPPFEGADATAVVKARFDGPPKPMGAIRGKVPEEVERLVARMLEVEPQTRYPTYGSLLGDMRRYLSKAGPVLLATSSKKIMIKNKRTGAKTGQMSTTGGLGTTGALGEVPPGMVPVDQIEEAEESEEAAGKRGSKMLLMIVGGVVLLAGVIAASVVGIQAHVRSQKAEAERAQVVSVQGKAKASIAKSVDTAKKLVERTRAYVPEALEYAKAAADAVAAVLGEGVRASMVPPEPDYAASQVPAEAATNALAAASVSNAVASVSNAAPAKVAAPVAVVEAPPAAAPAEGGDAHPVIAIVRGMYEDAYAVKGAALLADSLLVEIEAQSKSAESLLKPEKAEAEALAKLANALVEKVNNLSYVKAISEAPRKVSQLKKSLASVKTDAASLAEMKRQEALDKERKLKAGEAAEKKRLEQEAYKEKAKGEVDKVVAAEVSNVSALKQLQFREAIRVIKELTEELTTTEAKDAAALALERVNRVKDFHTFLVEKVPGFKAARGWAVDSADQKNLSVGGKKIAWVEVYASRLEIVGELIKGLVMDEKATKDMRLREKTRLMTNAALCLSLFYKEIPSAQELAKTLATQAAQQFDVDADSIKQLVPEFFQ